MAHAGYCRDESGYKGADLSKHETDDVVRSATQEAMTSPHSAMSYVKFDDGVNQLQKSRRFCVWRDDRDRALTSASASCRRQANWSRSSACAGHVVSLRPCDEDCTGSDVTVSAATARNRVSAENCRSIGLPVRTKPCAPSLMMQSSARVPSTVATAAATMALQRRLFLEALRSPPASGFASPAVCDRNSTGDDLIAAPTASYAAASAAAVLGTQLAIHAWFKSALDVRTSPLRYPTHDWVQRPLVPATLDEVDRNSSPSRPIDEEASEPQRTRRPASDISNAEHMDIEFNDDLSQSSSSAHT